MIHFISRPGYWDMASKGSLHESSRRWWDRLEEILVLTRNDLLKYFKKDIEPISDMNIKWYIPFYSLYLVLTVLHISFANTTFGLWKRFKGLNRLLRTSFLPHVRVKEPQMTKNPKITTVKANSTVSSSSSLASESYQQNGWKWGFDAS